MQKIIGVTELQRRFRSVFDVVAKSVLPYVLPRGRRPEAVLIPYEEYLQYQELQVEDILQRFDSLVDRMVEQNREFSEVEVVADVEAARAELDK